MGMDPMIDGISAGRRCANSICPRPNRPDIAVAYEDGTVAVWKDSRGTRLVKLQVEAPALAARYAPDGSSLAVIGRDCVTLFDPDTGDARFEERCAGATCLDFSPRGDEVIVGTVQGRIHGFRLDRGRATPTVDCGAAINSVRLSPGEDFVLVGTASGLMLVDRTSQSVPRVVAFAGDEVHEVVHVPGSATYAVSVTSRRGGSIAVCAAKMREVSRPISRLSEFSPDTHRVVMAQLSSAQELTQVATLNGHLDVIRSLDASPDGNELVTGADDGQIKVWDTLSGTIIDGARKHGAAVLGVHFASDDLLLSCSANGVLQMWLTLWREDETPTHTVLHRPPAVYLATPPITPSQFLSVLSGISAGDEFDLLSAVLRLVDILMPIGSEREIEDALQAYLPYQKPDSPRVIEESRWSTAVVLKALYEQARHEADESTLRQCARILTFMTRMWEPPAADGQNAGEHSDPQSTTAPRQQVSPSPRSVPPTDVRLLAEVITDLVEGRLTVESAKSRLTPHRWPVGRKAAVSPEAIFAGHDLLNSLFVEAADGRRPAAPIIKAARLLTELAQQAPDYPVLLAVCHDVLGRLLSIAGESQAAVEELSKAVSLARTGKDRAVLSNLLGNLGNVYRNVGELPAAERAFEECIAIARSLGDERTVVVNLSNLAVVYADLGELRRRRTALYEARARGRANGLERELMAVLQQLGDLLLGEGDPQGALKYLADALKIADGLGDLRTRAIIFTTIGVCQSRFGESAKAQAAFGEGRELAVRAGDRRLQADCLGGLGQVAFDEGKYASAEAHLGMGLMLGAEDSRQRAAIMYLLACCKHVARDHDGARRLLDEAAAMGDRLRSGVIQPDEAAGLQRLMASVHSGRVGLDLYQGHHADAFASTERGRAALLMRTLRGQRAAGAGDTTALTGRPLAAEEFGRQLAVLGERAVLVSWFRVEEELVAFVLRADDQTVQVERRDLPISEVQRVKHDFQREVANYAEFGDIGESWQRIADDVIGPIVGHLKDGDTLLLVPNADLSGLPLHALKVGGRRLIERWPVAFLPTASALPHLMEHAPTPPSRPRVLAVGFAREADEVTGLLGECVRHLDGSQGKEDALGLLTEADVAHVSVLGYYLRSDPGMSGLVLRPGPDLDSHLAQRMRPPETLRPDEIAELREREIAMRERVVSANDLRGIALNAQLVTLSACESGLVSVDPAEDQSGLIPTLIQQGARSVLATLWRVEPASTRRFMVACYQNLNQNAWRNKPAAVREATLTLMRDHAHPYYWAPFILIGGVEPGVAANDGQVGFAND